MVDIDVVRRVIDAAGGQAKLAKFLTAEIGFTVSTQRVHNWLKRDGKIPSELVLAAEKCTGISRHVIRPDIYPQSEI